MLTGDSGWGSQGSRVAPEDLCREAVSGCVRQAHFWAQPLGQQPRQPMLVFMSKVPLEQVLGGLTWFSDNCLLDGDACGPE